MHLRDKLRTLLDPENRVRLIVLLGAALRSASGPAD